jgi:hypothetical protein
VVPFINEVVSLDGEDPGAGASFFHPSFQVRFRNIGTSSGSDHFDLWLIDDVFLGEPDANPLMAVSPVLLSDTLLVGALSTNTVSVSNIQSLPSSLSFTVSEDPPADWLSVQPLSGVVPSGQSEMLNVVLDASQVSSGSYSANLIITANDTSNAADTVSVILVVNEAPMIRVEPDSIHRFLEADVIDSTTFTIYNDGLGPLDILAIEDDEINSGSVWTPSYVQKQKETVYEEKGEELPKSGIEMPFGSGGPDPFGYKWIDSDEPNGPSYTFTDISGSGAVVTLLPTGTFDAKDEGMATINLPFNVSYYGAEYNQLQVNSNGFITFDISFFANAFTNQGLPNFWDDLDGSAAGDIYYQHNANQFIIQWDNWGHYPSGTQNMKFQVVLFANSSKIWLVYENIDDQGSSSFGIENADGTVGLEIAFDQIYAHNQLLTQISKGADWLSQNPTSGSVPPGDSLEIKLVYNSTGLALGTYNAKVIVSSNDPVSSIVELPKMTLSVVELADNIVINEIMYNPQESGADSTEYIELINNDTVMADMSGWWFTDGIEYLFPPETYLDPGEFIVLAYDTSAMHSIYGNIPNLYQWTNGVLSNSGDEIILGNQFGETVDSVKYNDTPPWPTLANGSGPSLELINPNLDNSLAINWEASDTTVAQLGTPGAVNSVLGVGPTARIQVIHNAADPSMDSVDVYLNGLLFLENHKFRSATPYFDAPAGEQLNLGIARGNSRSITDTIANFVTTLEKNQTYAAFASGVVDSSLFSVNPDSQDIGLNMYFMLGGRENSSTAGEVDLASFHGITDGFIMDVKLSGITDLIFNNHAYGNFYDYVAITPNGYTLEIWNSSSSQHVYNYAVDLSAYADSAMIMFHSGFMVPDSNQNGAESGLFAVTPSGKVLEFSSLVALEEENLSIPQTFDISQNYPNPFNPTTNIKYQLPEATDVNLVIYNILGQKVRTLVNNRINAGFHTVEWDTRNDAGVKISTGVYIYRFQAADFVRTKKMILIK